MLKTILLHPTDNVRVVRQDIHKGDQEAWKEQIIQFNQDIALGHKVAAKEIHPGEPIIKYGVPIGSATQNIKQGAHVHLHNMKSDYLPTYTLQKEFGHDQ